MIRPKYLWCVFVSLVVLMLIGERASAKKPQPDSLFTASFQGAVTGTVISMNASRPPNGGPIGELEAQGSLCFPFNGVVGDGIDDVGDALLELNEADSDGNGIGDLFNAATAIVNNAVCLSGRVRIFVHDELDESDRPRNALVSLAWTGTEERRASTYSVMVGGSGSDPKNWWVCPDRETWPNNARILFGVDPQAKSNNCTAHVVVGQFFKVTRWGKKGGNNVWTYGHNSTTAHVEIRTDPE